MAPATGVSVQRLSGEMGKVMNQLHVAALVVAFGGLLPFAHGDSDVNGKTGYLFIDRPPVHSTIHSMWQERRDLFGPESSDRVLIAYLGYDAFTLTTLLQGDEPPEILESLPGRVTVPRSDFPFVFHYLEHSHRLPSEFELSASDEDGIALTIKTQPDHYSLWTEHDPENHILWIMDEFVSEEKRQLLSLPLPADFPEKVTYDQAVGHMRSQLGFLWHVAELKRLVIDECVCSDRIVYERSNPSEGTMRDLIGGLLWFIEEIRIEQEGTLDQGALVYYRVFPGSERIPPNHWSIFRGHTFKESRTGLRSLAQPVELMSSESH